MSVSDHNFSLADTPIWMQFLLNGCLSHGLKPYQILGQSHSDTISFFHTSLLTSLLLISAVLCPIKMKLDFGMLLRYAFGRFAFESDKKSNG